MTETPLLLGGRYELGEVIGRGGMAEVHVGRDTRLGRTVAIKILRADLARDPLFQARFRREAQSAAALNHPSIVAVYDTGEDLLGGAAVPYIVMEYVAGSTLRELLNSGRRLLPERALEMTAGVLAALDYSHRHGIIHRDIKPGNVMLTDAGEVKVMDFGIARAIADTAATMTQTAAVIGTAQYLSPEQAKGETVDARSDLYSTGCLLYELLTGRPPFVGDSPVAVAYQHVREEPVPPSAHDPDIPAEVDAVTLHALVKDRDERYQSAAQMRADVERALAGRPVEARPVAPPALPTPPAAVAEPTRRLASVGAASPRTRARPAAPPALAGSDGDRRRRRGVGFWLLLSLVTLAVFVGAFLFGRTLMQGGSAGTAQAPTTSRSTDSGSATGAARVQIPSLTGQTQREAETALQRLGLQVGEVNRVAAAQPEDLVLGTTPREGATVARNTVVALQVANGRNEVPDVTGQQLDSAREELSNEGFRVEVVEQPSSEDAGLVLDQDPGAGTTRQVGSTVRLVVAAEEEAESTPTPSTPSPSPSDDDEESATPTPTPTETEDETPSPSPSPSPSRSTPTPTSSPSPSETDDDVNADVQV